jgi:hypothetical protein
VPVGNSRTYGQSGVVAAAIARLWRDRAARKGAPSDEFLRQPNAVKRLLQVVGVLAIAFVVPWLVLTFLAAQGEQERREQEKKVVALGQALAPALNEMTGFGDALADACKDKLTPGAPRSLALYTLPLPETERPSLSGARVDGRIAAWSNTIVWTESADPVPAPRGMGDLLGRYAEWYEWPNRWESHNDFLQETRALRYVAVALFSDLHPASLPMFGDGKSFDPGEARYRVKVVTFPEGKPVCEGVGKARMHKEVIGHGKARSSYDAEKEAQSQVERKLREKWIEATIGSPLEDLCSAGGAPLCTHARLMTDAPDW